LLIKQFNIRYKLCLLRWVEYLLASNVVLLGLTNALVPLAKCRSVDAVLVSIMLVYDLFSKFSRFNCCNCIINWSYIRGVMTRQSRWLVCCFGVLACTPRFRARRARAR
jgi:hypothetical protein